MTLNRTSTDGEPYYCKWCGEGYATYLLCEAGDCSLESKESALSRLKGPPVVRITKQVKDLSAGDVVVMEDDSVRTVLSIAYGLATSVKGGAHVRGVLVSWLEGDFSVVARTFPCQIKTGVAD